MKLDHITIHTDNNPEKLAALKESLLVQGYPFDPKRGRHNRDLWSSRICIGDEYLEVVRLLRPKVKTWMPLWTQHYTEGKRGAYCIFLEDEDVERIAVALKKAGIKAVGPAVLTYPTPLGIFNAAVPYFIYYLPCFPNSCLQIGLMQYTNHEHRAAFQSHLKPNADSNGILGIRRVTIALPNLDESMDQLQKVFGEMRFENDEWSTLLKKVRFSFRRSPDAETHLQIVTATSQRGYVGKTFQIDNVEVATVGG